MFFKHHLSVPSISSSEINQTNSIVSLNFKCFREKIFLDGESG